MQSTEQKLREALQALTKLAKGRIERLVASEREVILAADQALALPTAAPVGELPELPEPTWSTGLGVAFTADQMRAYALSALSDGDAVKPAFKVYKGEVCYKSDEDDQSYGMWCPVSWEYKPPFPEGTEFVAAMRKGQL